LIRGLPGKRRSFMQRGQGSLFLSNDAKNE